MAFRHYYSFDAEIMKKLNGKKLNKENWDIIRNDEDNSCFSSKKTREQFVAETEANKTYQLLSENILKMISENNLETRKIVSLGAGNGNLEYLLKKGNTNLHLEVTDYAPESITSVGEYLIEADKVFTFDMFSDSYSKLGPDVLILMSRVSTEFSKNDWIKVLSKMQEEGIKEVLFIPTECLTFNDIVAEIRNHLIHIVRGKKSIFCGWMYTENEFKRIFKKSGYSVKEIRSIIGTDVFYLCNKDDIN